MNKSPNYIKKTLEEIKLELLKDKKLQISRQLYVQKLKEIFNEQVIELKDGLETRMSSTGTDKTFSISSNNETSISSKPKQKTGKNEKIIFLNNEIIDQNLNQIEEANNELSNFGNSNQDIIELKDEVSNNNDQKIIDLRRGWQINLTEEVAETVVSKQANEQDQINTIG